MLFRSGLYYPLSSVLVTNIKNNNCQDEAIFIETSGDYVGKPTIFEMHSFQPFVGPNGRVEYYKAMITRSDIQELYNRVYC